MGTMTLMTHRPVWISGLARSGTSVVARICHQMGISMGVFVTAPMAGTDLDLEYEEACLAASLVSGRGVPPDYVEYREAEGFSRWGAKSPMLLPYMDGLDGIKILTRRPYKDCQRSASRISHPLEALNCHLAQYSVTPDIIIDFGTDPVRIAETIAEATGADLICDLAISGVRVYNSVE